jgi:hypothetical protein
MEDFFEKNEISTSAVSTEKSTITSSGSFPSYTGLSEPIMQYFWAMRS